MPKVRNFIYPKEASPFVKREKMNGIFAEIDPDRLIAFLIENCKTGYDITICASVLSWNVETGKQHRTYTNSVRIEEVSKQNLQRVISKFEIGSNCSSRFERKSTFIYEGVEKWYVELRKHVPKPPIKYDRYGGIKVWRSHSKKLIQGRDYYHILKGNFRNVFLNCLFIAHHPSLKRNFQKEELLSNEAYDMLQWFCLRNINYDDTPTITISNVLAWLEEHSFSVTVYNSMLFPMCERHDVRLMWKDGWYVIADTVKTF